MGRSWHSEGTWQIRYAGGRALPAPPPAVPRRSEGRGDQRGASIRPGKWVAVRGDVADLSFNSAHRGVTIRGAWRSEIRGRGRSPDPTSRFTAGASEMRGRGRSPHPHLSLHGRGVRDVGARALPTPPPLASRQGLRGSRQELRAFENAESSVQSVSLQLIIILRGKRWGSREFVF